MTLVGGEAPYRRGPARPRRVAFAVIAAPALRGAAPLGQGQRHSWLWVQQVLEERLERPSDLTRDDIVDNITLFWLTNTGVIGAAVLGVQGRFFAVKGVKVPVGMSAFADEIYRAPRSWTEQASPNLVSYNRHDRGGHFAAWEQPQLLAEEVRETFGSLR